MVCSGAATLCLSHVSQRHRNDLPALKPSRASQSVCNFQLQFMDYAVSTVRRVLRLVLNLWSCAQTVPLTAVFCSAGRDASYAVRLCKNPQCPRMVWNRDVNASINMVQLMLAFAQGDDKPGPFCRGVAV